MAVSNLITNLPFMGKKERERFLVLISWAMNFHSGEDHDFTYWLCILYVNSHSNSINP